MPSYARPCKQQTARPRAARPARPAMSTEVFLRDIVFAKQPRPEYPEPRTSPPDVVGDIPGRLPLPAPAVSGETLAAPAANSGFACRCDFGSDGKLRTKLETYGGHVIEYGYTFDKRGHLSEVRRNGALAEEYTYNAAGQRTMARTATVPGMSRDALRGLESERSFAYDRDGRLVRAGRVQYGYASDGSLRCREVGRERAYFQYGNGSVREVLVRDGVRRNAHRILVAPVTLDSVLLPSGDTVRYRYNDVGMPFLVLRNDALSEEYQWHDPLRLARFRDHRTGTEYVFHYEADEGKPEARAGMRRMPHAVTVRGPALDNLGGGMLAPSLFRSDAENRAAHARSVTLRIGCDQVGTVKALTDPDGTVVKRLEYDSFGLPLLDTCPYFFFPLGFAGGLVDRHTGLVRFGFRDYDPRTGRFTAPDPLGDTGGDHDLYDYCVDDPVSAYDPTGLIQHGLAARGWDESKHPRATDGRFTFAHGGAAGSAGGEADTVLPGAGRNGIAPLGLGRGGEMVPLGDLLRPRGREGGQTGNRTRSDLDMLDITSGRHVLLEDALPRNSSRNGDPGMDADKETPPKATRVLLLAAADTAATDAGGTPSGPKSDAAKSDATKQKLPPWDKEKALDHLRKNAHAGSTGNCGVYVRQAIEAGGLKIDRLQDHNQGAKDYGPNLERAGFVKLPDGADPQAGDVVVIQSPGDRNPKGHMAMFAGKDWISDYNQKDEFYPGRAYSTKKPPYVMYRRPE
ncbi:MAG TPA: RHS repeat-associated core domain-containing protein [Nitratidesulfovibrio sp.]|nr:RHS repeat-associated core domain-containing protein [Nitratidesulfovibrio sp.]